MGKLKSKIMDIDNVKAIYFVGIGGIGMSALARYFKIMGYHVAGYDKTESPLTRKMTDEEEFDITYEDDEARIGEVFRDKQKSSLYSGDARENDNDDDIGVFAKKFTCRVQCFFRGNIF